MFADAARRGKLKIGIKHLRSLRARTTMQKLAACGRAMPGTKTIILALGIRVNCERRLPTPCISLEQAGQQCNINLITKHVRLETVRFHYFTYSLKHNQGYNETRLRKWMVTGTMHVGKSTNMSCKVKGGERKSRQDRVDTVIRRNQGQIRSFSHFFKTDSSIG